MSGKTAQPTEQDFEPRPGKMNVNQAAKFLDAHPYSVRKWIRQGKLPAHRIGKQGPYVLYKDEIENAMLMSGR